MEGVFKADALKLASKALLELFVTTCVFVFAAEASEAQQPHRKPEPQYSVERIELVGPRREQPAKLGARIVSRVGDTYSEDAVRRAVQALRDTGFFEDVRAEVEDSPDQPNARIVVFIVREKPIVRRIDYRGTKSVTAPEILNALNDKEVGLSVGSWFDQTKLNRAALVIKGLLSAHGRASATVKPTYERFASTNTVNVVFDIDEGPS
jgi:outer membrane protein insertion porin family